MSWILGQVGLVFGMEGAGFRLLEGGGSSFEFLPLIRLGWVTCACNVQRQGTPDGR